MKQLFTRSQGFTYLITVSLLCVVIIFVFLSVNRYSFQDKQDIHQTRIMLMNDFVKDFNQDVHRATFIASFRSLLALEDHIAVTGDFFNDTEDAFKETFFNGTILGQPASLLNDSSFADYLEKVNLLAERIGLHSSIVITNITLSHSDPWFIDVKVYAQVNVTDVFSIASWHFQKTYTTQVPIYDLRDPLYSTFTNNLVPNTVRRLEAPFLVNISNNDTTYLQALINSSYYLASSFAPSFLQRFENNVSSHPFGIESIVSIGDISLQTEGEFVYEDRIKVDYMYFNNIVAPKLCQVDGLPLSAYFVIPQNRASLYELTSLTYETTSCP